MTMRIVKAPRLKPKANISFGITVVAAGKFVKVDDVALETVAEGAAENGIGLERRGADPVVVISHAFGIREVDAFEDSPDIRPPYLGGGIAGAVGQQDGHSAPPPRIKLRCAQLQVHLARTAGKARAPGDLAGVARNRAQALIAVARAYFFLTH
jgi:hypothetical protein